MTRVTDDTVQHALRWALNYGEISEFKRIAKSGRKWRIRLPFGVMLEGGERRTLATPIPTEVVLTNREALVFAFGCAAAGDRPDTRRVFAAKEWGW